MANEEKDVCTKGKSCKTTCIKKNLVCQESVGANIQSSLSKLVSTLKGMLPTPAPPKPSPPTDPASQTLNKGREFLRPFAARMDALDKRISELRTANRDIEARLNGRGKLSAKDRGALRTELSRNLAELKTVDRQMVGVMNEIRNKMLSSSRMSPEEIKKIVDNVDFVRAGKKSEASLREQLSEFVKMFGGKGFSNLKETPGDISPLTTIFYSKERAWANGEMGHMRLNGDKGTTFHEMGHFVEFQRPWLTKYAQQWRNNRAWDRATVKEMYAMEDAPPPITSTVRSGNRRIPLVQMSYLAGGKYDKGEVGMADEYFHPYMGKVYEDRTTEVVSMSIEQFSSPYRMAAFRRAHPELFDMVVGLSRD